MGSTLLPMSLPRGVLTHRARFLLSRFVLYLSHRGILNQLALERFFNGYI
jgi:hypothetical protein